MSQHNNISTLLLLLMYSVVAVGQDASHNYIMQQTAREATGMTCNDAITYYDGLGRPMETVRRNASPTGKDLVSLTQYDAYGRGYLTWRETPIAGNGGFTTVGDFQSATMQSHGEITAFDWTAYENSARDVVVGRSAGGDDWILPENGPIIERHRQLINTATGTCRCRKYTVNAAGQLVSAGDWDAATLRVEEVTDEDGKVTLSFTDQMDHEVLIRKFLGETAVDTYQVYDGYGELRYVLPPMASAQLDCEGTWDITTDAISKYGYYYEYNTAGCVTLRKWPGREHEVFRYDRGQKLILSQDGNQRAGGKWTLSLYDRQRRPVVSALVTDAVAASVTAMLDEVLTSEYNPQANDATAGYSTPVALPSSTLLLKATYYDDYSFLELLPAADISQYAFSMTAGCDNRDVTARGLTTGERVCVLGSSGQSLLSVTYYNSSGTPVQTRSANLLGGVDVNSLGCDYQQRPLLRHALHTTADTVMTDVYSYTYDNMGRLLTVVVEHDGDDEVQLAQNTYNKLGRLTSQWLGETLEGLCYFSYNVRGWTTGIENTNFRQTLHYQDTYGSATPCYNGNISAMEWREKDAMMAATPTQHHYCYSYDGLNRLTVADYGTTGASAMNGDLVIPGENQARDYDCTYQYDLNGNVTSLTRKGVNLSMRVVDCTAWQYGAIDNLSLTYEGNQLKKVTDQCSDLTYEGAMEFRDGANKTTEYLWDANGNMTRDRNKGIYSVSYNVLNLPQEILFNDGHIIRYKYAADGRKLRTEYVLSNIHVIWDDDIPVVPLDPAGGAPLSPRRGGGGEALPLETTLMTRDYCGNHIYRDSVLERITNDYGYWADGQWYYHIKDYQGNVRAVIDQLGTLKEVNNYYPYGALMGGGTVGNNVSIQPYKYGTKELDRQNGLDWYDFEARQHDPLVPRFTTMDPMAEKYYSISPYAYCGGNPIRYIDIHGDTIDDVQSLKQHDLYLSFQKWIRQCLLFAYIYEQLQSSPNHYHIQYGNIDQSIENTNAYFDPNTETITIDNDKSFSYYVFFEELYHMFQYDQQGLEPLSFLWNREFEAKLIACLLTRLTDCPFPNMIFGITEIMGKINTNPQSIFQLSYQQTYAKYGASFVKAYKGVTTNKNYLIPVISVPRTFRNCLNHIIW